MGNWLRRVWQSYLQLENNEELPDNCEDNSFYRMNQVI